VAVTMTTSGLLVAGLAGLGLAMATGAWLGYRYAVASRRLDAILIQALDTLDTRPEDETPAPRPKDWEWDAEVWWPTSGPPCNCRTTNGCAE